MKFGMRKPSIKRSISARTTGKLKRSIKKTINPLYGKKGMGFINNPKKAVYNKIYNKTTFSVKDVFGSGGGKHSRGVTSNNMIGCSRMALPIILIVIGLLTVPVGLIFIAVGVLLLVLKSNSNKVANAQQEDADDYENQEEYEDQEDETDSGDQPLQPDPRTEPVADAPQKKTEKHRVAGTSYRLDDIMGLLDENAAYNFTKKELTDDGRTRERIYKVGPYYGTAVLEPEPDNPVDPNAIKVVTAGVHIGYIKSGSCAHIHKVLREGRLENAEIEITGGAYKILLDDYDDYTDKSTYTLERGTIPFFAVLTLTLK